MALKLVHYRLKFTHNRQQETYHPKKVGGCGTQEWKVVVYDSDGNVQKGEAKVGWWGEWFVYLGRKKERLQATLNGIGTVRYEVGEDHRPVMKQRQGAICVGECAPLASLVPHKTNGNSSVTTR